MKNRIYCSSYAFSSAVVDQIVRPLSVSISKLYLENILEPAPLDIVVATLYLNVMRSLHCISDWERPTNAKR